MIVFRDYKHQLWQVCLRQDLVVNEKVDDAGIDHSSSEGEEEFKGQKIQIADNLETLNDDDSDIVQSERDD